MPGSHSYLVKVRARVGVRVKARARMRVTVRVRARDCPASPLAAHHSPFTLTAHLSPFTLIFTLTLAPTLALTLTRYEWLPGMRELCTELQGEGVPMAAMSNYPAPWYE